MRARVSMAAMMKVPLTHKGWFGVCPVYTAGTYGGNSLIVERHWLLLPLFMFSDGMFALCFMCMAIMNPLHEPALPLKITGKLPAGRTITLPDDADDDASKGGGAGGLREGWGAA